MKHTITLRSARSCLALVVAVLLASTYGCKKTATPAAGSEEILSSSDNSGKQVGQFMQVNLVANNNEYGAARIDPVLMNAWGLTFSPNGIAWIGAQAGHVSTVYNGEGAFVLGPVHIPSPGAAEGGNPTGVVFNPNATDFIIPGGAARFIFVGVDGVVSGWNPSQGNHAFRQLTVLASAFTGLTLAMNGTNNLLYAANFRAGKINVWDKNWMPVDLPFRDTRVPRGFSPFNIQNIGGLLYVTYAKVGPDGRSQAGRGLGFVDIFSPAGMLLHRFAEDHRLNAPWGLTMAAASFFPQKKDDDKDDHHDNNGKHNDDPVILVGNFGDGRINVFRQDGKFLGQLGMDHHHALIIPKLWAIMFPPTTSTLDQNRLYFTAGPDDEHDGLFGYIIKQVQMMDDEETDE